MTDATKLYKGATALRKGMAMFAWLGDVEAALKEVPELEKTLENLHRDAAFSAKELERIKTELIAFRGEHSGAKAQAGKIISGADEIAAAVLTNARASATKMVDKAEVELSALRETIEKESEKHGELMAKYYTARSNVKQQVDELNAELAAIKARL